MMFLTLIKYKKVFWIQVFASFCAIILGFVLLSFFLKDSQYLSNDMVLAINIDNFGLGDDSFESLKQKAVALIQLSGATDSRVGVFIFGLSGSFLLPPTKDLDTLNLYLSSLHSFLFKSESQNFIGGFNNLFSAVDPGTTIFLFSIKPIDLSSYNIGTLINIVGDKKLNVFFVLSGVNSGFPGEYNLKKLGTLVFDPIHNDFSGNFKLNLSKPQNIDYKTYLFALFVLISL